MTENIRLWLRALRGEEKDANGDPYRQAREVLRRVEDGKPIGYCCLGVACDLYVRSRGLVFEDVTSRIGWNDNLMPATVADWLGLGSAYTIEGDVTCAVDVSGTLAVANDAGATFADISDAIERAFAGG